MIPALDWLNTYAPAALAVWRGESPFSNPIYFAAPWGTLPLIPFALMPPTIGRWCLLITAICSFAFVAYRLGAKPLTMSLFLLSAPVLGDLVNGNIEWMPMLGFILPPQIGLIFVLIKPQVGIGIAIYWLVEAWQSGGIRQVVKIFSPVTVLTLISFALYGFWPLRFLETLAMAKRMRIQTNFVVDYNLSLWPFGVVLGFALMINAIKTKNIRQSIMAGPFLSPYALMTTYATSLLGWTNKPLFFFTVWLITWIPTLFAIFLN